MELVWDGDGRGRTLLVTGPGAAELLSRALADPDRHARRTAVVPVGALRSPADLVPMAGRWDTAAGVLTFVPRLPFARGTTYALVSADDPAEPCWVELARLPLVREGARPTTTVVAIHPDVDQVPENLLRVSVTFSAPMDEGSAAGRVHLRDPDGTDLDHALLPMPPELWDRPRRRLTLLLEPGRIKRGLVPNLALGAPLAHRTGVDLVVDASMRDAAGGALVGEARRTYRVGPAVRARVDPGRWGVAWPSPASRTPLVVGFERPLDHALVLRSLRVTDRDGQTLVGTAALAGGVRWSFTPLTPWPAGPLALHVDAALEDLAGNSVHRVFDRDLHVTGDDPIAVAEVVLSSEGVGSAAAKGAQ